MADKGDKLVMTNLSRNEVALWIFCGFFGVQPNIGRSVEDAIMDVISKPGGPEAWMKCQQAADAVLAKMVERFSAEAESCH